ncbi:MAG TPA: 5-formyltetrahydrofolate cyclo-ligase [Burkholderiaceae bacterium]|nr:5-formyltetrahydrofolate cyclo-ligase [Burkholderiaceae bacterium]
MIAWRCALDHTARERLDRALGERLDRELAPAASLAVGVYWPVRGEPDLRDRYDAWARAGCRLALPVSEPGRPLRFIAWSPGAPLIEGRFQIPQPAAGDQIEPDLLVVPCVGFSPECVRLGYGGGHYDRTLAARRMRSIGVAYDETELAIVPGAHDIPLDAVVTPTRVVRPSSRGTTAPTRSARPPAGGG